MYAEKRSTFPRKKRRKNLQTLTAAGALCFSEYARGLAQKKAIMPQFCLLRKLGLPPKWVRYMIKIATVTKQKRLWDVYVLVIFSSQDNFLLWISICTYVMIAYMSIPIDR